MKLAAMEGLWRGSQGQEILAFGVLNPSKSAGADSVSPYLMKIGIPKGLSLLARHDINAFVPGIDDIIDGVDHEADGTEVNTISYAERIERGKAAQQALREYSETGSAEALSALRQNYSCFGYGYYDSPEELVPPVGLTFYSFHLMVIIGGYLIAFFIAVLLLVYKAPQWLTSRPWINWVCILSIPLVWICSQCGWIIAEVGRQPWVIQNLMPTRAAISSIEASSVRFTFWLFAATFTVLLVAEISIMLRQIKRKSLES
jgi:cytochrome d ubiquinol oxidase subunit I